MKKDEDKQEQIPLSVVHGIHFVEMNELVLPKGGLEGPGPPMEESILETSKTYGAKGNGEWRDLRREASFLFKLIKFARSS